MVKTGIRICPDCNGTLHYYDTVKRIVRGSFGKVYWIHLRRLNCKICGRYHRELPNYILPYKHYEKDIIKGFITNTIKVEDIEYEDYPCETTIKDWRKSDLIGNLV